MTIEKMKWYKVIVDGQSYIVRIDDRIFSVLCPGLL